MRLPWSVRCCFGRRKPYRSPKTLTIMCPTADYAAFEKILAEADGRTRICIAAYCLMPNH